jgi:hypothetical protein
VGLFGRPVPRGSWAAWACEPHALSPVAATTCRVRMAAWKALPESPKVGLNETFPAKFQHLYTTLTWWFLSWSGARETLSVVSTVHGPRFTVHAPRSTTVHAPRSTVMGFHGRGPWRALLQNLARQSRCELRAMEPAVCPMIAYPDRSRRARWIGIFS